MHITSVTKINYNGSTTHAVRQEVRIPQYPWRKFTTLCGKTFWAAGENQPVTCKTCLRLQEQKDANPPRTL